MALKHTVVGIEGKLSLAMHWLAHQSIVFLDEPTTGVDRLREEIWTTLVANTEKYHRRLYWHLTRWKNAKHFVRELLLWWMERFRCLGSTQHWETNLVKDLPWCQKRKEMSEDQNYFMEVQKHIEKVLPSAQLKDIIKVILHITSTNNYYSLVTYLSNHGSQNHKWDWGLHCEWHNFGADFLGIRA